MQEGQQKAFHEFYQMLRSPLRITFQAFEGLGEFCHNTKGSPRFSVVLLIDMQQSKREDPFCLALVFPFPLPFRFQASGGVPEKSGMTHIYMIGVERSQMESCLTGNVRTDAQD
jgi:hypothetical protein